MDGRSGEGGRRVTHAVVQPSRVRYHSPELHTDVLRGFGFRARCQCGWAGPNRQDRADAVKDSREHRCS